MSKDRKELRELAESQRALKWKAEQGAESLITSKRMWHVDGPRCIGCFEDWGFDENSARYIAAADPATVLALLDELDQLKAENAELKAQAGLQALLPELDEALEDLEIWGRHSDQGYRKLKDWYRKVSLACRNVDIASTKEQQP